ncbi:MAG: tyrosinase family protein, partial [Aeromicrobium sp.]
GTWWFLPWHRMYLIQFERIIAHLTETPNFALPYWDYPSAAQAEIPPAFLETTSPLYDGTRVSRQIPDLQPDWIRAETFTLLGGGVANRPAHHGADTGFLEQNPHNLVHGSVGGDMASFQSPLDPLFWIHHCNVDRLWEVWRSLPVHANPRTDDWLNSRFDFPDPTNRRKQWAVSEVGITTGGGYEYDSLAVVVDRVDRITTVGVMGPSGDFDDDDVAALTDAFEGSGAPLDPVTDAGIELVGASISATRKTPAGEGAEVTLETPIEMPVHIDGLNVIESRPPPTLLLRLENLGIEGGDASEMWSVFASVDDGDRHLVGTIVPFGLAGLTRAGGRQTLTFDISRLASEFAAAPGSRLRVTCEPVDDRVQHEPFWERAAIYKAGG